MPHDHDHDHHHDHPHHRHTHGAGHNHAPRAAQWQTPHQPDAPSSGLEAVAEADFDLVEAAFAAAFPDAEDPTSFLRLAGVPFIGDRADGTRVHLLRVEQEDATDVGSVTPGVGGSGARYAPLPQRLVSRRKRLSFLYFDGETTQRLTLAEARDLSDCGEEEGANRMTTPRGTAA